MLQRLKEIRTGSAETMEEDIMIKRKKPTKTIVQVRISTATLDLLKKQAEEEGVGTAELCSRILQAEVDREGKDPQYQAILKAIKQISQ